MSDAIDTAIDNLSTSNPTKQIPGSAKDRAFFSETVSTSGFSPALNRAVRYGTVISSANGNLTTTHAVTTKSGSHIISSASDFGAIGNLYAVNDVIKETLFSGTTPQSSFGGIKFGTSSPTVPTLNALPSSSAWEVAKRDDGTSLYLTDADGNDILDGGGNRIPLLIPNNAIWFKPLAGGVCDVAFSVGNKGQNGYKSIYRFLRDEDGKIVEWTETVLKFTVDNSSGLDNKTLAVYQYEITDDEAEAGYEYAIGNSTSSAVESGYSYGKDSTAFFFLSLAGADDENGDSEGGSEGDGEGGGGAANKTHAIVGINFVDTTRLESGTIEGCPLVVVKAELSAATQAEVTLSYLRTSDEEMSAAASGAGAAAVTLTQAPANPIPPLDTGNDVARLVLPPGDTLYRRRDGTE